MGAAPQWKYQGEKCPTHVTFGKDFSSYKRNGKRVYLRGN